MASIFVRNNTSEEFSDRFDGQDYTFPVGELVECPLEAVMHIFGYGLDDKSQNMIRLGWAATSGGLRDAYKKLDKFEFLQGMVVVAEPHKEPPVANPEDTEVEQSAPVPQAVAVNPPASSLLSKIAALTG